MRAELGCADEKAKPDADKKGEEEGSEEEAEDEEARVPDASVPCLYRREMRGDEGA